MFKITTPYDHSALVAVSRTVRRTLRRRSSLICRIIGWTGFALLMLLLVLLAALGGLELKLSTALELLVAAALLGLLLFEDHLNAWIGALRTYQFGQTAEAVFTPEEYILSTPGVTGHWTYDTVKVFAETKHYFVFLLDRNHGQLFAKSGFTEGNPEDFRQFIREKTGLSVITMR